MDVAFSCTNCGQSITIDEAGAGQFFNCPKCGTEMEVPDKSASAERTPEQPANDGLSAWREAAESNTQQPVVPVSKAALAQKVQGYSQDEGGWESGLEIFGAVMLGLGILGAIGFLVSAILNSSVFLFAAAFASLIQGIFFFILFRAGAEAIRLLKKIAGLPFAGKISTPPKVLCCSKCNFPTYEFARDCPECGAKFQDARQ